MDTYSYISENGTVRQIEDLLAKAKNEEQDARLQTLERQVVPKSWKKVWEGSAQVPASDGFDSLMATLGQIVGAEKVAIRLSANYGNRSPNYVVVENVNGQGLSNYVYGNFTSTPPYVVEVGFRVNFLTGQVYGSFNVASWAFSTPNITEVYKWE